MNSFTIMKKRGKIVNQTRASEFTSMVYNCKLIDMGFKGNRFTWLNKRFKNRNVLIYKRLDRYFANSDWLVNYPNAHVRTFLVHIQTIVLSYYICTNLIPPSAKSFLDLKLCGCPTLTSLTLLIMHGLIPTPCPMKSTRLNIWLPNGLNLTLETFSNKSK